jgi:uncharacterized protein YaaR (DUF327 family)
LGRKRKFGEASGWVSVRVPTSKILEYREAVREFVESKFAIELTLEEDSAFLFFQVPKNRVGEYKVAVEEFVKDLLEREGGTEVSDGEQKTSVKRGYQFRDFRDFSEGT